MHLQLDRPQPTIRRPARQLSLLATLAIVGQLALAASALFLPIWSEYGLIGDNIRELALGRFGYLQTAAFLAVGLGTLGLAYAIRRLTAGSRGSLIGSVLIAVYGVGAIGSAVFPTDRIDSPAALVLLFLQAEGLLVGLMQRLLIAMLSTWLIPVALHVHATVTRTASAATEINRDAPT